ncbi:MAG: hypothetical protein ACUZ8N_03215 [Candidatus Scalindua sp.]
MKNRWLILSAIFTLVIIQNCTTTEKQGSKTEPIDKEIHADLQRLKSMLGYSQEEAATTTTDTKKTDQPIEFGLSVAQMQEQFPAPDKFEYDPMVNKKVTMLARDTGGGRFTFFFYEDKLYKIVIISKWSNYAIQFAEEDIKKTEAIFIEGNGEPDFLEEDETHKKMVWLNGDVEITLELFSLMTHKGMSKVMTLMYADRNIILRAKAFESFELYKTRSKEVADQ